MSGSPQCCTGEPFSARSASRRACASTARSVASARMAASVATTDWMPVVVPEPAPPIGDAANSMLVRAVPSDASRATWSAMSTALEEPME
jgi:hypothetical protein